MATIGSSIVSTGFDVRVTTPTISNVLLTTANTEVSHALPASTKMFLMQNRGNGRIQLSYTSGQSGITFVTIWPGNIKWIDTINPSAVITIYMQSNLASQTVEIESWA